VALNPNIRWPSTTRSRERPTGPQPQYQWPSEERILTEEPRFTVIGDVVSAVSLIREDVARFHATLVQYNLVQWTGGNVSGRVPGEDPFVIKPSGVSYDMLTPESCLRVASQRGDLRQRRWRGRLQLHSG